MNRPLVAHETEAIGQLVILIGCVAGTMHVMYPLKSKAMPGPYHGNRELIGRSILLGLEFLVAGDVIRSRSPAWL